MTVASSKLDSWLSLAVSRNTYDPVKGNVAVVDAAFAFANVAVPGPLTLLHVVVSVPPAGNPSSVTVPFNVTAFGIVIVESGPAFTTGG